MLFFNRCTVFSEALRFGPCKMQDVKPPSPRVVTVESSGDLADSANNHMVVMQSPLKGAGPAIYRCMHT